VSPGVTARRNCRVVRGHRRTPTGTLAQSGTDLPAQQARISTDAVLADRELAQLQEPMADTRAGMLSERSALCSPVERLAVYLAISQLTS
jgi:hypothetical protein